MLSGEDMSGYNLAASKGMSPEAVRLAILLARLHRLPLNYVIEGMADAEYDAKQLYPQLVGGWR